jgi:class 3 adenylate cyclase
MNQQTQALANPLTVLIFERYARGLDSIDKHQQRPAHADLQETMGARRMTRRRVMTSLFSDIDHYGWWSRPERARHAGLYRRVGDSRR